MASKLPLVAVVDDEASVCRALLRLLRTENLRAESYGSAQEFLDSMPQARPDCVVLDLQMPLMSGLQLQEQLQKRESPPPVIVITSLDQPGVREQCLALGASSFLHKPVDGEQLLQLVHETIASAAR